MHVGKIFPSGSCHIICLALPRGKMGSTFPATGLITSCCPETLSGQFHSGVGSSLLAIECTSTSAELTSRHSVNEGQDTTLSDTTAGSSLASDDYHSIGMVAATLNLADPRPASSMAVGKMQHVQAASDARRSRSADLPFRRQSSQSSSSGSNPLRRHSSLSDLPEVAKSIELRYKLLLLGVTAAKLCKELAGHSCVSQNSDAAEMTILCEVPRLSAEAKATGDGDEDPCSESRSVFG